MRFTPKQLQSSLIKFFFGFIFFSVISFPIKLMGQYEGELEILGKNYLNHKPLKNTEIRVTSDSITLSEFNTKDKNSFKVTLAYGKNYDIYLINPNCQTMFFRVLAKNISENIKNKSTGYSLNIPFFPKNGNIIDTLRFEKPFHQVIFDGKSNFVDDTEYMKNFIKNIFLPLDTNNLVNPNAPKPVETKKTKELSVLVGKLTLDDEQQTILSNKTITVLNKKAETIATCQTNTLGIFVIQNADMSEVNGLSLNLSDAENPFNKKIRLSNSNSELAGLSINSNQKHYFINKDGKNVLDKIIDNDYGYKISGKLVAINGNDKKIASGKNVYLLDDKNAIIQKTKTNLLGNFLFRKIIDGFRYTIAYDSADVVNNYSINLFSVRDKFISKLDSCLNKQFRYSFTSNSSGSIKPMIMNDTDLKMDVYGKLCGDYKNNPLSDFTVYILNDKSIKIDSCITNSNGIFTFKRLPFTKDLTINTTNKSGIQKPLRTCLVFDSQDNLIKSIGFAKDQTLNYKPLPIELSKLNELYFDDSWLQVADGKSSNYDQKTIIENIGFEYNKADLQVHSQLTLDKIVLVMQKISNLSIELGAHSDSKGSDARNLKLSDQRANSAKDYLISKGIDVKRILAKGYGESKLINHCANGVECTEEEHAANRRLEFKLIFNK